MPLHFLEAQIFHLFVGRSNIVDCGCEYVGRTNIPKPISVTLSFGFHQHGSWPPTLLRQKCCHYRGRPVRSSRCEVGAEKPTVLVQFLTPLPFSSDTFLPRRLSPESTCLSKEIVLVAFGSIPLRPLETDCLLCRNSIQGLASNRQYGEAKKCIRGRQVMIRSREILPF